MSADISILFEAWEGHRFGLRGTATRQHNQREAINTTLWLTLRARGERARLGSDCFYHYARVEVKLKVKY